MKDKKNEGYQKLLGGNNEERKSHRNSTWSSS